MNRGVLFLGFVFVMVGMFSFVVASEHELDSFSESDLYVGYEDEEPKTEDDSVSDELSAGIITGDVISDEFIEYFFD